MRLLTLSGRPSSQRHRCKITVVDIDPRQDAAAQQNLRQRHTGGVCLGQRFAPQNHSAEVLFNAGRRKHHLAVLEGRLRRGFDIDFVEAILRSFEDCLLWYCV